MIVLRRELSISTFFVYDLNTATGITHFNKMLFYMRQQLYSEIPSALDKELNRLGNEDYEYNDYVVEYEKKSWDARRLVDEIHKYPYTDGRYLFNGKLLNPDFFEEMILSRKPFDLYLYIKTIDEYEEEKRIKTAKKMILSPIFIKGE